MRKNNDSVGNMGSAINRDMCEFTPKLAFFIIIPFKATVGKAR